MTVWKDFGYAVVMYMAGLYSVPTDALEAARVDGANVWQIFRLFLVPVLPEAVYHRNCRICCERIISAFRKRL